MPNERILIFNPSNLGDLLTHYTEGVFPLGARILNVGLPAPAAGARLGQVRLDRHIAFLVESDQWQDDVLRADEVNRAQSIGALSPLQIRYEGKRTLTWGNKHAPTDWKPADNFSGH